MRRQVLLAAWTLTLSAGLCLAEREGEPKEHARGLARTPQSAGTKANPYEGSIEAVRAGQKLFTRYCASCHGEEARSSRRAPPLDSQAVHLAVAGKLFWFLTNGNLAAGMPSWSRLSDSQRWQLVTFLKTLRSEPGSGVAMPSSTVP